jgi:hypothetical protein
VRNRFLCSAILVLALAGPNRTVWGSSAAMPEQPQEPAGDPGAADANPQPAPETPEEPKKKKKKDESPVRIKGRLFVRDTITKDGYVNDFDLASARLGAVYRDRTYDLRIELEAELAGNNAEVRDAYVRLEPSDHVRVQAGRFKRPISAISMASRWDLPVIERGYLNDLEFVPTGSNEADQLPLGGRFLGATTTLRDSELPGQPELVLGVFRSAVHRQVTATDGTQIGWSGQFPEDVFTRLELEPAAGLTIGASLAWVGRLEAAGDPGTFRHGFVSGLDAVVEMGMFRGWFEAFVGANPLHLTPGAGLPLRDLARGQFLAARGIAAARVPVTDTIQIEPYAAFQILNTSDEVGNDRIMQGGGGLNVRVGEAWRVQTAVDRASVDSNPLLRLESATLFIVQLGAAF